MRRFAFVSSFIVVALFGLPIVGALLGVVFGNPLNLLAILIATVAWYAGVLVAMRIIARRAKKRLSGPV